MGSYSVPIYEMEIPDPKQVSKATKKLVPAIVWKHRLEAIQELERYRHQRFIAGVVEKANFGYGEGTLYNPPVHKLPKGRSRTKDDINRVMGQQLALADMGYFGTDRRHEPFPGARRCIGGRNDRSRCREPAMNGKARCREHQMAADMRYGQSTRAVAERRVIQRMADDLDYKGHLVERAKDFLGQGEIDISQELALSRAVLQEAIDMLGAAGGVKARADVTFMMDQIKVVAGLVKANVDVKAKVAMTEADLRVLQSRIMKAMILFVPEEHHETFLGMIIGRGVDGILAAGSGGTGLLEGVPEGEGEEEGEGD